MLIYLDNCCYNRPYDDQSQLRVSLEAQAKLHIQALIRDKRFKLVTSYVLLYENSRNPYEIRRNSILTFIKENSTIYVDIEKSAEVKVLADEITLTGIKAADAHHVAGAIIGGASYFLTTDNRLLKYRTDRIALINPLSFIYKLEAFND